MPSKERPPNTDLQRAPLLEAQVEIEIAAGDIGRARSAADELELVAARFESKALVASAALARGRVRLADGDAAGAEQSLSEAVRLWNEVGAPYEAALARMGLAEAHRASGSEHRAVLERQAARTILDGIEAAPSVAPAADVAHRDALDEQPAASVNVFRREGDYWSVIFDGHTVRVRDLKGMRYLARLLADPGREYHVLDLVAAETGSGAAVDSSQAARLPRSALGDAGEMLDARAKDAYRRRLAEIDDDIEQARAIGDAERAAQADAERDFLVRELARAVGLGGRDRRAASASERARAGVTRAVRQAITRIGEHHPQLGEHLNRTIRTGTYCAYFPDPRGPRRVGILTSTAAAALGPRLFPQRPSCQRAAPPSRIARAGSALQGADVSPSDTRGMARSEVSGGPQQRSRGGLPWTSPSDNRLGTLLVRQRRVVHDHNGLRPIPVTSTRGAGSNHTAPESRRSPLARSPSSPQLRQYRHRRSPRRSRPSRLNPSPRHSAASPQPRVPSATPPAAGPDPDGCETGIRMLVGSTPAVAQDLDDATGTRSSKAGDRGGFISTI